MTVKWERAELMKSEGIAESATICFQRFVTSNARPRGSWASLVAIIDQAEAGEGSKKCSTLSWRSLPRGYLPAAPAPMPASTLPGRVPNFLDLGVGRRLFPFECRKALGYQPMNGYRANPRFPYKGLWDSLT
jgi:hypothetical protein